MKKGTIILAVYTGAVLIALFLFLAKYGARLFSASPKEPSETAIAEETETEDTEKPETEDTEKPATEEEHREAAAESDPAAMEDGSEQEELRKEYEALTAELLEMGEKTSQAEQREIEDRAKLDVYRKYEGQINSMKTYCRSLNDYNMQYFSGEYDESGIAMIEENNKFNHVIGEMAKLTPFGVVMNFLTAGTIAASDKYYKKMVKTNQQISNAFEKIIPDVQEAVEKVRDKISFYESLIDPADNAEAYRNGILLQYIQGDKPIEAEAERFEATKKIYQLAEALDLANQIYSTVYGAGSAKIEEQYNEARYVVRNSGIENEVVASITPEERAEYLLPICSAAVKAIGEKWEVTPDQKRDVGFFNLTPTMLHSSTGSRVYYLTLPGGIAALNGDVLNIVYLDGKAVYVNGYYLYGDQILNNDAGLDGAAMAEEAEWMRSLPQDESKQRDFYAHNKRMMGA